MRTVLDTKTVLSAALFESGRLTWIRDGWSAGRFLPLCSVATTEELIRALAYPTFRLDEDDIRVVVGSYIGCAEAVRVVPDDVESLPRCRDAEGQKFLELAKCGRAEVLVTGDADLLALAAACEFDIVTPAEFKKRISESASEHRH